ncbi:MAG TPA: threonine--tRNA ligase [Acidimicrobiia bacterium]|nr:threonine--tRNA ligase [Acidimicrobiia bacterium]
MSPADAVHIKLPDGSQREYPRGVTAAEIAQSIGKRLAKDAIAARVDGDWVDLDRPIDHDAGVTIVTPDTPDGREVLRHSTAHVMAQAVTDLFPGARYAIGPAIADGFYYDFELPEGRHFTEDDLGRIEARMREIVAADEPFVREEVDRDEGLRLFADQPYKIEIIERVDPEDASEVGEGSVISVYRNPRGDGDGAFVDLCRGPHVPSTKRLGAFKLMRVAGAYWRGDEKRPMLQRIYGTAWESQAALDAHLHQLEEAERRDHRKLGVELDLFSFPGEIGSGLAVFHPKGGTVRRIMEDYSRERHVEAGYEFVTSPHIAKEDLFHTSGHLEWFAEGMFPPMELDEGTRYYLKPMNCPFHILIYQSQLRSYRDLPLRLFEFGTVYRYERSGVVHGLTRVRGMTQDDAHIFCTKEQLAGELESTLRFVLDLLKDFGLTDFYLELSTKPEGKAIGSDEEWDEGTEILRRAAAKMDLELVLDEGGGAFYGPKISVQTRDAIGRTWQLSTIQADFQEPQRFDLSYVGADNERHRPIMIHRALFGAMERFFAILLEHYAGAFPAWLAPVQVTVLPVADRHDPYAFRLADRLRAEGFRAGLVDAASDSLRARIRRAKLEKVPYILVVGDEDADGGTVGVNRRGSDEPERGVRVDGFVERLAAEVAERR